MHEDRSDEPDAVLRGRLAKEEAVRLGQCVLAAVVGVLGWGCAAQFGEPVGALAYLFMTAGAALFVIDAGRSWDQVVDLRRRLRDRPPAGRLADGVAWTGVAVSGVAVLAGLMTVFAS